MSSLDQAQNIISILFEATIYTARSIADNGVLRKIFCVEKPFQFGLDYHTKLRRSLPQSIPQFDRSSEIDDYTVSTPGVFAGAFTMMISTDYPFV